MQPANRPNLHRKFITFVLAASMAITGFSAVPARADEDVARFIAGLAVLGILGAAINQNRHQNTYVSRSDTDPAYVHTPRPQPPHVHPQPRPLPPRVTRYDLPSQCLRYFPAYRNGRNLLGQHCLGNTYRHVSALPQQCRVTFWNGRSHKNAFRPDCLRQRGYRFVRR